MFFFWDGFPNTIEQNMNQSKKKLHNQIFEPKTKHDKNAFIVTIFTLVEPEKVSVIFEVFKKTYGTAKVNMGAKDPGWFYNIFSINPRIICLYIVDSFHVFWLFLVCTNQIWQYWPSCQMQASLVSVMISTVPSSWQAFIDNSISL